MKYSWKISDKYDEEAQGTIFRDILLGIVGVFLLIISLLIILPKSIQEGEVKNQANLQVLVEWQPGIDVDIDLWARTPSGHIVGYANRSSEELDLMRDDLGLTADPSSVNFEVMFSRGIAAGEWVFTVHYYSNKEKINMPITIKTIVYHKKTIGRTSVNVIKPPEIVLTRVTEEKTVIRMIVNEEGEIVSWDQKPVKIRTFKKGSSL